ncbi:ankyrin repeat domain-containing protein [Arthrobacter sp. ISL-28]|uniref:ankyrin repeat domain-containing protein n=1 Tax=Arthrobacter sp. ISL-28 TaxID=2819108 RepID=UPI001BE7EC20|nr:ankyrin repeat domain-containing protein [Arthrobacter sp. ISL-28]MBT2522780.1 ankyrin repeat domain-containing protein [Arthrobacter sp. ISL-28]
MTGINQTLSYRTRANHFKNGIAMGGHLWLQEGPQSELVFRAHGIFQRRYELRLMLSKVRSFVGGTGGAVTGSRWTLTLADGTVEEFLVAGRTGLREALLSVHSNARNHSIPTGDPSDLPRSRPDQPASLPAGTANSHVRRVETASAQSQKDSELPLRAAITATPQLPGFKHLRVIGFSTALKRFAQAVPRSEGGYGLDVEGSVISWESRTGLVSESQNDVYEPVRLPARCLVIPGKVVQIAGSRDGMLALTEHGDVYAWGEDYFDEIGEDGRNEESPLHINGLDGIVSLASTGSTHFAIGARGEVWSWGSKYGGCLGDGSEANRSVPALVPHLSDVREVRCSEQRDQVVALTTGGAVLVWGYGYSFDGDKVARSIPTELIDLPKIRSLGDGETAIDGDGHVWRWGEDLAVKQVPDLTDIVAIVHGSNSISNDGTWHALDRDGRVYGWGCNNFGQIGDGTTIDRDHPVPVTGLTDVVALVTNSAEAYALTSSGTVCAWGGFPSEGVLENYGNMETIHGPVPQRIPLPHFTESRMQRWATLELASLGSSELRQTFFDFRNGRTPLMQCAAAGLDDEVSVMLAQSGDVNAVDTDGDSALFYAASKGQMRNVELLLRAGANPHIHRPGGNSALAQAAGMSVAFGSDGGDYWQVALLLLRRGADPSDMYSRGIAPARHTDRGMLVIRPENLYSYLAYDDTFPIRVVRESFVG